jgi:chromosome segregation ATPase
MKKSASNFSVKKVPTRRAISQSKLSFDDFTQHSEQLSDLTAELSALKKEKEVLHEYTAQLLKSIAECQNEINTLVSNQDKLHNEARNINKFTRRYEQQRFNHNKTNREVQESVNGCSREIEELKERREEVEGDVMREKGNVGKLQEVIFKMKSELIMQEKERERFKGEGNCAKKQIRQLEEKVEGLKKANLEFVNKIKLNIYSN